MATNESERYEIEVITSQGEERTSYNDLDVAAATFYRLVSEHYGEPSDSVYLHDLVQSKVLALWVYDPDEDLAKVVYEPSELRV